MIDKRKVILKLSPLVSMFPHLQTKLLINNIDRKNIPNHIAIIMDGNGRWAKKHGLPRLKGHLEGTKSVKKVLEIAYELNIKYLTLFAFSQENWDRPKEEVEAIIKLIRRNIENELNQLNEKGVKITIIGNFEKVPEDIVQTIKLAHKMTKNNSEGKIDILDIKENIFKKYLYTKHIPDPDLLIRTSGEIRISNFLLWQMAYTEFVFTPVLWPDFDKYHVLRAILEYQTRERRFGLVEH